MSNVAHLRELREFLSRFRFTFCNEGELQAGIAQALAGSRFIAQREYPLTPKDRLDFFVDDSLVIEVKIGGSAAAVMRQVSRYAEHDKVQGILLITTRASHALPESFNGKPVLVHSLMDGAF